MPEGHTIHRLARDHGEAIANRPITVSSPQGRFDAALVAGKKIVAVEAWGKHLFYRFGGRPARFVHVHLGLFGKFFRHATETTPRATTRMRLATRETTIDLVGPTACEVLDRAEVDLLCARLGVDPLRDDADLDAAAEALHDRRTPIGALLLDQSVVSGIGNVYRAEILFLHRLHPATLGSEIPVRELRALLETTRQLLRRGVENNRIITVSGATLKTPRDEMLYVYKRKACKHCGEKIASVTSGGRALYYCQRCQPVAGMLSAKKGRGTRR
ncbi:MAG: DNA-formamidopyrimidine glycosylase family protein [Polyangia bacterium]